MKIIKSFIAAAAIATATFASADLAKLNGHDWVAASPSAKREQMQLLVKKLESWGCKVTYSPGYYVRQIDDFYANSSVRNMTFPNVLTIIATGAGENWDDC